MKQKLIFTELVGETLDGLVAETGTSQVIVIADTNTVRLVLPRLAEQSKTASTAMVISVEAGDDNKTLDSLTGIWQKLSEFEATRNSMVVNLGGGMVSDLGGFAAATFKRGMRCVNIPTTLLAAVDASVGGKTGINFNGFKNQVGAFAEPVASIISTTYFDTLPQEEILSGYGEMLKHGLLEGTDAFAKLLIADPEELVGNGAGLLGLLERSIMVKSRIVTQDPTETGATQSPQSGAYRGACFRGLFISPQQASAARLCRCVGTNRRARAVAHVPRLPDRAAAPACRLRIPQLRCLRDKLRRLRSLDGKYAPGQEKRPCRPNQLHPAVGSRPGAD